MSFELQYEILKLLGWVTLILVILSSGMFFLIKTNQFLSKIKSEGKFISFFKSFFRKLSVINRGYHKVFGAMAIVTGILHGAFLTRRLMLHSGYFLWSFLILSAITGISMGVTKGTPKYRVLRKVHRFIMFMVILLMVFHVLSMKGII